jgi:hypothetical protein
MATSPTQQSGHFHAVRFYDSVESLARMVVGFLAEGLAAQQPALAIATPDHGRAIDAALAAKGWDVAALKASGELTVLDAEETLAAFMVDGMPDAAKFQAIASAAIERACGGRKDCTIRAYGEMVDLLWKRNQSVAAIRLEMLWNKLAATNEFSLLCGYAMGNFLKDARQRADVCRQHTHLLTDDETAQPISAIN